jgi:hypothetical protein
MTANEKVTYPEHPWYQDVKIDTIQKAIWAIMCEISYVQKQKSPNLNYTFAGEAALIRALRPYMEKYGVIMSVIDQKDVVFESYQTAKGSSMNRTRLMATVRFYHAPSGTFIDVTAPGEGADSGDKSGNKANTCAYKYALRQTFVIETGDDPDEDASERSQRAAGQPIKAASGSNGKVKTYQDLLDYADKQFKMEESKVKAILTKHHKFMPEEWTIYVAELKSASEQPA